MRKAKLDSITTISCYCPLCGGECEGAENGTLTLIGADEPHVTCIECGEKLALPKVRKFNTDYAVKA